ncbi:MAG: STAS domain-containing protein [Planctomycetes bacterium]|nr:STAS domain-containing protein [Planctomycetota bacterium]
MEPTKDFFEIETQDDVLIVTPTANLGELDFGRISDGAKDVLGRLVNSEIKRLILDFHRTSYFGSTALGFFVRLWRTISIRGGRMAFCHLSENEAEILTITKLDHLWSICATKEEALRTVRG